ncbi:MAG: hypothetical protein QOG34_2092 [Frankiaceae bacterium]|jgi:hypothetical protein|nr:hypothetical protein [Frankiaceae bacterium]
MMLALSRRTVIATSILATTAVAIPVTLAATGSQAQPANKAVAAASKTAVVAPNTNKTLLTATFKTSKPEDLLISVSAECSILTNTVIHGGPTAMTDSASAGGRVRVWLELDGKIVPLQDTSTPPQDPATNGNGDDTDKVTFCDQVHQRSVTDNEDKDGTDGSKDYLLTKSSAAFNWVRLNAGSGDHTLVVKGDLILDTATADSSAQAVVGNRTLIIEPTKLANNAVISDPGTN